MKSSHLMKISVALYKPSEVKAFWPVLVISVKNFMVGNVEHNNGPSSLWKTPSSGRHQQHSRLGSWRYSFMGTATGIFL